MLEEMVTYPEGIIPPEGSDLRRVLKDHKLYMLKHPDTKRVPLVARHSYPERHNLYAYCLDAGIATTLIYPIMLLNDINNNMEFKDTMESILIPSESVVNNIASTIIHN